MFIFVVGMFVGAVMGVLFATYIYLKESLPKYLQRIESRELVKELQRREGE